MSLNFVNSFVTPAHAPRRAQDDLYLRGPVLLANALTNPLTMDVSSELLSKTWRLATVGKRVLLHGPRFENALWRKWGQYKFARERFSDLKVDWEWFMEGFLPPFVPLVISDQTCHCIDELPFARTSQYDWACQFDLAQLISPRSVAMKSTRMDSSVSVSIRSCLKGSTMTTGSDSSLSFRSTTSTPPNVRVKRTITFNSYVSQSIILDTTLFDGDAYGCVVSDGALSDDELDELRSSCTRPTRSRSSAHDNGSYLPFVPSVPTSATLTQGNFVAIQALPPAELFPPPRQDELNNKIVFVPPNGVDHVGEHDLIRLARVPPAPKLKRTVSSRNLAVHKQNLELESALTQVGEAASGDATFADNGQGAGNVQASRQTRRKRASFSTGGGDEEDQDQDWMVVKTAIASRAGVDVPEDGTVCVVYEVLNQIEFLLQKGGRIGAGSNGVTKEAGIETSIDAMTEGVKGQAENMVHGEDDGEEGIGGDGVVIELEEEGSGGGVTMALLHLAVGGVGGVGAWLGF